MITHYDRDGNLMSSEEWCKALEDPTYKRVAKTVLPDGRVVSTVWLGLNHSFDDAEPPLIFETMVFEKNSYSEIDCERYSTEREAMEGHLDMAAKWRARIGLHD